MTRNIRITPYIIIVLGLLFLYAPVLVMMLMSFNQSRINQFPIVWDLVWFERLAQNERLIEATVNSLIIAIASSVIATVLGTLAALGLNRQEFRGKRILELMLIPPITIPWLILAIALLIMFFWLGIERSLITLMFGHVVVQLPYTILVIRARLAVTDPSLEEAALSLGAPPTDAFRRVTLPIIAPGVLAAFMFAFAVSFDNFIISYFLAPPGVSTLPVEIYTAIRTGFTPEINAVSTIVFAISAFCVLVGARDISTSIA
jgi:spermidine/putrescine transport system permease protein